MKKKTKLKFSSVIFVSTCLLIFFTSMYCFFADFNKTVVKNEKEIATIYFKKKIAQRKFSDSVVWERLQQNSLLYNEDIIRTDAGSSAVLTFLNGASIDLGEHSMIQIFQGKDNEVSLQVSSGNIVVDTKEAKDTVKVNMGNDVVINLEKGSVLSTDATGETKSFVMHEGTGSVVGSDGKEDVVFAGETISVDKNGEQQKLPVTVLNLTQNQQVLFFEDEEKVVELKLKTDSSVKGKKIIVESSYTSDFSDISDRIETDSSKDSVPLSAQPGTLYYRIYPEDEAQNVTEGKLVIEPQPKVPELVSPLQNSAFEVENYNEKIQFTWKTDSYTDYSRIEIYDESDPETPVFSDNVYGTSFSYSKLYEGSFLWKVVPHYAANKNDFGTASAARQFSVAKKVINESPVLLFPADNSTVTLDTKESTVLFGWKSDVKDSAYNFEIAKDEEFRSVLYDSAETDTRKQFACSIDTLPEGKYFWRVARSDVDTESVFYSNVHGFSVLQYVPATTSLVYPPDNFVVEGEKLKATQFSWKIAGDVPADKAECILQFSTDGKLDGGEENPVEFETASLGYKGVQLGAGTYLWQIKVVDKDTKAEIAKTDARKISVVNPLASPAFVFPKDNAEYIVTPDSVFTFKYENVSDADSYSVKVYNAKTNEIITKVDATDSTFLELPIPQYNELKNQGEKLPLKCAVTAFSNEKENSPMRVSRVSNLNFSLKFADKVVLSLPENNSRIAGLAAVRTPVRFSWAEDENVYKKEFVLTKKMANGTTRVVNTIQNPKNVSLNRLSPGEYSWTVTAETKDGVSLSADEHFNFTILPVPLRESVSLVSPQNDFLIGPKYLKNNRKIVFEWKKDSEATDYEFALYQKNKNGTLRRIVSEKTRGTRFVFSDLAKLDVGEFEWHVISYTHARDGFEEQKSKTAKANFAISFDLPKAVKTIDPGELYGN